MIDHDQRFKMLIQAFFGDLLGLFFRAWAERLDADSVTWMDKEVFPDPPQGRRGALDLVGQIKTRQAVAGQRTGEPEHWLALVHIEIESPDKAAPLRPRMFDAYAYLRGKHQMPVLPVAVFLNVGLDGVGTDVHEEHFWELRAVRFEYLYVGLPALDAIQYVQGDNWLGVALAALMKIPKDRIAWLGAEALRRIQQAPLTDQQRFLLAECVQAYLPLNEEQQREFERLVATEPYQGVQAMNTTWYEKGQEQGQRKLLRKQLELRFGSLSASVEARLQEATAERLDELAEAVLKAGSLRELGLEE